MIPLSHCWYCCTSPINLQEVIPDQEGWRWAWCELNIRSSGGALLPCFITDEAQRCGINLSSQQRHCKFQCSYMSTHVTFQMSAMIFVPVKMSGISVWFGLSYLIMFPFYFVIIHRSINSSSSLHNLFLLQCALKLSIQIVLTFESFTKLVWWKTFDNLFLENAKIYQIKTLANWIKYKKSKVL